MSDTLLSRLPRFDTPQLHLADREQTTAEQSHAAGAFMGQDGSYPLSDCVAVPESDLADPIDDDRARAAALDQAVGSIESAIIDMRQVVREEAILAISRIASTMFPKLSELFLVDEIAQHLPGLIPDAVKSVEVSAAPDMAADLQRAAERIAVLPATLTFIPVRHFKTGQIEVSWKTGGFDLDFDALLASCMASMNLKYIRDRN